MKECDIIILQIVFQPIIEINFVHFLNNVGEMLEHHTCIEIPTVSYSYTHDRHEQKYC